MMITTEMVREYGAVMKLHGAMETEEALAIMRDCKTTMEIAENSYIYGYMKAVKETRRMLPVFKIEQIPDDKWNEMTKR